MKTANAFRTVLAVGLFYLPLISLGSIVQAEDKSVLAQSQVAQPVLLRNDQLELVFDQQTGTLTAIENRLAGETYGVEGDHFEVEAVESHTNFAAVKLIGLAVEGKTLTADYRGGDFSIQMRYILRGHFVEKQMTLTSLHDYGLKKLTLSRPRFSGTRLEIIAHRYPAYGRKLGEEPCCTFFGRTPKGGFFLGTEVPFDASSLTGTQAVLAYSPSLKVKANEQLKSEPVYFGVYRRRTDEKEPLSIPLRSESDAMVAMTSAVLGPPRFGLVPMACGWHSEMAMGAYTEQSDAGDMKSLDFLAECGIDWLCDSHPWGGETEKMNALGENDPYEPGPLVRRFLEHARKMGVNVGMWSSMNNTHAWSEKGRPFRSDKPEWLIDASAKPPTNGPDWRRTVRGEFNAGGNCLANRPFCAWLERMNLEGMAKGQYKSWAIDGDFFGGAGLYTTIIPVDCQSDKHDHLPGNSNYVSQRALAGLIAEIRERYPQTYIWTCRPPMDLGIWSLRNVDACFTLVETGTGNNNVAAGNDIRTWSRTRVHRDFFPHYIDQPLLFPSRCGLADSPSNWPSAKLDYILLSALSSSPNQLYYMPTKSGIPDQDKEEIRKWLDWGRKHIEYLKVRKDLPDWPAVGKVDGSAHLIGDRGLIFLFNPGKTALSGEFVLTEESIGLKGTGNFQVRQEYPARDQKPAPDQEVLTASGQTVHWEVPAETAVVLRVQPVLGENKPF